MGNDQAQIGITIASAAQVLDIPEALVVRMIEWGQLRSVTYNDQTLVEPEGLEKTGRAIAELRARKDEPGFIEGVLAMIESAEIARDPAFLEGMAQLRRGQVEPA